MHLQERTRDTATQSCASLRSGVLLLLPSLQLGWHWCCALFRGAASGISPTAAFVPPPGASNLQPLEVGNRYSDYAPSSVPPAGASTLQPLEVGNTLSDAAPGRVTPSDASSLQALQIGIGHADAASSLVSAAAPVLACTPVDVASSTASGGQYFG